MFLLAGIIFYLKIKFMLSDWKTLKSQTYACWKEEMFHELNDKLSNTCAHKP